MVIKNVKAITPLGEKGFTLVELIISLVMSGIVMAGMFIIVSGSHDYTIKERKLISRQIIH